MPLYSYDLSSATDRLPVSLQRAILAHCFGDKFAQAWVHLLVGRPYRWNVPRDPISYKVFALSLEKSKRSTRQYNRRDFIDMFYSVGQPMGALSSWGMLALTHHFIVQVAAWRSGFSSHHLYKEYCVLGDDIVIYNTPVAIQYLLIMKSLGVEVGLAKSLISPSGAALEFAKKTYFKGEDVSPLPYKEFYSALGISSALLEFVKKYNVSLGNVKKLLGLGYKSSPKSLRWSVYEMLLSIPSNYKEFFFLIKDKYLNKADRIRFQSIHLNLSKGLSQRVRTTMALIAGINKEQLLTHVQWHLPWRITSSKSALNEIYSIVFGPMIEEYNHKLLTLEWEVRRAYLEVCDLYQMSGGLSGFSSGMSTYQYMEEENLQSWYDWEDTLDGIPVKQLLDPIHKTNDPGINADKRLRNLWNKWIKALKPNRFGSEDLATLYGSLASSVSKAMSYNDKHKITHPDVYEFENFSGSFLGKTAIPRQYRTKTNPPVDPTVKSYWK